MTLRPEYSLGHSAYNGFLFGSLGQDAAGTEVTVLSALSRLGIDPWQEAARLAALPRDAAAEALAATILRLPDRTAPASEAATIAARLVALLPEGAVADIPQTQEARASLEAAIMSERTGRPKAKQGGPATATRAGFPKPKPGLASWLMWGALALAFYFLLVQLAPSRNLESEGREFQQNS
ncbi:hypothetical protein [Reyranella sp.]|jgi:hypothetical protein|uniref:hypothetical protein n=1 Tax=Reyranella sp. TaxID=1929291 RepID=UPI000BCB0B0E|nr:hypothetical protein [Reyranella sp.]OYY36842.1 MAG: hypothetical protein B7Y57_24410 [Rhodospirillales bacterium 35-66-84]OYZ91765.1 MAG: hypothetical protein B7Y08_24205 [Rhodospirillales bacterium 24-66-33]OZB23183.1 MAG: hypothetical protein B7X63_20040 [Rhodospirillales bacterium 39-66-50]HQS18281.1 hypothetical protein [Reyranella sp.]HQT09880.1 hypothetical protein [Reyranella sp.]